MHPDVQIVPLRVGRADVVRIGIAFDPMLDCADAFCGAVALLEVTARMIGEHAH
jgi:hypothetical protein